METLLNSFPSGKHLSEATANPAIVHNKQHARDAVSIQHFGEFARFNFPRPEL